MIEGINQNSISPQVQLKLEKLEKAAKGIEALFMKDLLAAMRRGTPETSLGNSFGSKMYRDMFDQAMADGMSKTGSLGIARILFKQLSKQVAAQEAAAAQKNQKIDIKEKS
jgi:Rod binding domain-containing protein